MGLLIYIILVSVLSYFIQMNAYESVGITFFVIMAAAGVIFKIFRMKPIHREEAEEACINVSWRILRKIIRGLCLMIFAVFLFLNMLLLTGGVLGICLAWLVMIIGIKDVWFGIIDVDESVYKEKAVEQNEEQ